MLVLSFFCVDHQFDDSVESEKGRTMNKLDILVQDAIEVMHQSQRVEKLIFKIYVIS